MATKTMKIPGPDHPMTIEPNTGRVVVAFAGETIADSTEAMALRESDYPPVFYVPRDDVKMELLTRTDHATHCPYKGDASYFTIDANGRSAQNAVWSYEDPYPAAATIKQYLAFYPDRVDRIEAERSQ
jgi:uncharacterized protein (DUF427 family)